MAAPLTFESQIPALIDTLMGKKTTTTSSANIDPLQQVFTNAMTASGAGAPEMTALIDAIFREGAAKVPELANAYGNAAGVRTTGNSGLQLALGDLNRQMSSQAAAAILTNQTNNRQIAEGAAGNIANSTKGTIQKQSTGTNPLIPVLAGWGLNKLDKNGTLDKISKSLGFSGNDVPSTALGSVASSDAGEGMSVPGFEGSGMSTTADMTSNFNPVDSLFNNFGSGSGGGFTPDFSSGIDTSSFDVSNLLDFGSAGSGVADIGSTLADSGGDIFGAFGWKDGGKVSAKGNGKMDPKMQMMMQQMIQQEIQRRIQMSQQGQQQQQVPSPQAAGPVAMADGGAVSDVRNKNYMGTTEHAAPLISALNPTQKKSTSTSSNSSTDSPSVSTPSSDNVGGIGVTDASNTNDQVDASPSAIGGLGLSALGMVTGLPTGLAATPLGLQNLSLPALISHAISVAIGSNPNAASDDAGAGMSVPGAPGSIGMSTTQGLQDSMSPVANALGSIGSTSSGGMGGSAPSGGDQGDSGSATGGALANGGKIAGPGTGTSDSIPARLSDGEYVFPADVVRFFGTSMLDQMKNLVHKPVPSGSSVPGEDSESPDDAFANGGIVNIMARNMKKCANGGAVKSGSAKKGC